MRVLHVLGECGFSGGEDQLLHVVRALEAAGHENAFVLQGDAAFAEHAEAHGAIVGRVRMRGWQRLFAHALRRVLASEHVDLVHLADSRAHKLGMRAGADRRAPVVVTRRMDYPVKRAALKRSLYGPRVAAFVAISQAVGDELVKAGVDVSRVHVIHDGVDPSRPKDTAGVVGWYNRFSDDLPASLSTNSYGFEAYYNFHVAPWLRQ